MLYFGSKFLLGILINKPLVHHSPQRWRCCVKVRENKEASVIPTWNMVVFLFQKTLVPFFTSSFSFKKHIVQNSYSSLSKVRFFVALTGYRGLDSCLHRTKLSPYIIPLLKLFCWLSVTLQIDFKIPLPYKGKDCFACA